MLDSQISAGFWQKFLASDWSRCRCWWENPWWVYLHRRLAQKIWLFVEGDSAGFFFPRFVEEQLHQVQFPRPEICPFFSEFHWTNPLLLKGSTREYFWDLSRGHFPITTHLNNWISQFLDFFGDFQSFSSHLSVSQNQVMRYTLSGCHWMGKNGTTLFRVFPSFFQKPIYESPFIAHWISVFSCFKPSIYH